MTAQTDEVGPIDIVIVAYPAGSPMTGEAIPLILDLVERGIIRVLDVLFVMRDESGAYTAFKAEDLSAESIGDFKVFEGASSGLLGDEDAATAAEALEPGSGAALLVYENRWAAGVAAAIRRNGGQVLDIQRVPVDEVLAALGALETA